ncbi:MAG TPA: hypothetical protein VIQ11_07610 [Mycobacterium sp.]
MLHKQQNSGGLGDGNPPAIEHRDEALQQLRKAPGAVARMGVAIDGELNWRKALFGGPSDGTPTR